MKRLLLLFLLWPALAHGTTFIFTSDSLPKTLGAGYEDDTIKFSGDVSTTGNGLTLQTQGLTILGEGKTMFFGTGGGNFLTGIYVDFNADTIKIRDLNIVHDPDNDGDAEDTLDAATNATVINFNGSPYKFDMINCTLVVYGNNGMNLNTAGSGPSTRNITLDSVHVWNYCHTFASRHSYDGSAIRINARGQAYAAADFAAHIYRSVVHIAPQIGIAVYGDSSSSVMAHGIEIAYCSLYVDAHTLGSQLANEYAILTRQCGAPYAIHHNYIQSGSKYAGSRGIMVESTIGKSDDSIMVYNNTLKLWIGPDLESAAGECRGIRVRNIDNHGLDYVWVFNNRVEIWVDTLSSTAHIGKIGWPLNFTIDELSDNEGRTLIENNTFILRSMSPSGAWGAAFHAGVGVGWNGVDNPVVMRNNKYISSINVVFGADDYNGMSGRHLTFEGDTLSFLPAGDTGVMVTGAQTWLFGEADGSSTDNVARNCYYDTLTGVDDIDIDFFGANSQVLELVQRITVSAVGTNNQLVANTGFRITNRQGLSGAQTVLDAASIATGDTLFDFRYWKTYGTGAGSDSDFNRFDVWVWSGSDTTKINDTLIDWRTTCLPVHLAATAGTLDASDTCAVVPSFCPVVTRDAILNGAIVSDLTPNYVFDIEDGNGDSVVYRLYQDSVSPPTTLRFSDTVATPISNITLTERALNDRKTYYWRIAYADTIDQSNTEASCAETTSIFSYFTDTVKCPNVTQTSPTNGATVTSSSTNLVANFQGDGIGSNIIVRLFGEPSDVTPDVLLFTDTLSADSTGWTYNWTGLTNGLTYYWQIIATDPDCADTHSIFNFPVVISGNPPPTRLDGVIINGTRIGKTDEDDGAEAERYGPRWVATERSLHRWHYPGLAGLLADAR